MNADLIVFGEDWGSHPSSTQHLIHHMPGQRKVVWVHSIGLRRPRLGVADVGRAFRKVGRAVWPQGGGGGEARPEGGPRVVQPLILPMARGQAARAINRALLARGVGGAARESGLRRPVLWTSLPSAVDAIGALGEAAVVYYCGDDFGALAGVDHQTARAMEAELADRADLILAASPMLAARFPAHKTHFLPHGVDHALFASPAVRAEDMPSGMPVAGFYGALAPWLDLDLIASVARVLPHWRFVFVGPVQTDVTAIASLPNVTLLGARPHTALPGYARHWTAGIIPFRDNAQIRAANPLKLREYLAAGRPVVTTEFPALGPYRQHVTVAGSAADFAAALEATRADNPAMADQRQASVAGDSWTARAAQASTLIDRLVA